MNRERAFEMSNSLRISVLAGGISSVLGLVVLMGWYTKTMIAVKGLPGSVPMEYITAVEFLFLGLGLVLVLFGRKNLALACFGIGALTAILSIVESMGGKEFGLVSLGRHLGLTAEECCMGVMTSISFVLISLALINLSLPMRSRFRPMISGILGSVVAAIGLVAFFTFLSQGRAFFEWNKLASMSVHTALGLTLLGSGITTWAWHVGSFVEDKAPRWVPIPVAVGLVTLSLSLFQVLIVRERSLQEEIAQFGTESFKDMISRQLEDRILEMYQMAEVLEWSGNLTREVWEFDGKILLSHSPGYQGIEWVNLSSQEPWRVPDADLDPSFYDWRDRILENGKDPHRVMMTQAIDLKHGGKGFLISIPVIQSKNVRGFILGYFHVQEWIDSFLSEDFAERYSIAIFDESEKIYSRNGIPWSFMKRETWDRGLEFEMSQIQIPVDFPTWNILVIPSSELLSLARSPLPLITLFTGVLFSIIFTFAIRLNQTALLHMEESRKTTKELERQITERNRAEKELKALNETLENRAAERSAAAEQRARELARTNSELERFNRLAVGREMRIIELKRKVNDMAQKAGQVPPYDLTFLQDEGNGVDKEDITDATPESRESNIAMGEGNIQ
jgi:sensor domain CHASE-containing protein